MYLEKLRQIGPDATPAKATKLANERRDFDFRANRLAYFSDMLLACGWERREDGCWIAPPHLRPALELEIGKGGAYLWSALAAQAQADELSILANPTNQPAGDRRFVFVGEKPSQTAHDRGWNWESGRLAAATLFDALQSLGIDPSSCKFVNLFGDHPTALEQPNPRSLRNIRLLHRHGYVVVAMGRKVERHLRLALPNQHLAIRHPAARGAGRARAEYHKHVAEVLGGTTVLGGTIVAHIETVKKGAK